MADLIIPGALLCGVQSRPLLFVPLVERGIVDLVVAGELGLGVAALGHNLGGADLWTEG